MELRLDSRTRERIVRDVVAQHRLEGMEVSDEEARCLCDYAAGRISRDEYFRRVGVPGK